MLYSYYFCGVFQGAFEALDDESALDLACSMLNTSNRGLVEVEQVGEGSVSLCDFEMPADHPLTAIDCSDVILGNADLEA